MSRQFPSKSEIKTAMIYFLRILSVTTRFGTILAQAEGELNFYQFPLDSHTEGHWFKASSIFQKEILR